MDVTILKEAETFSQFILKNSSDTEKVEIDGDGKFLFKAYKPIRYLVGRSHLELTQISKKPPLPAQYFYLGTLKDKEKFSQDANVKILKFEDYGSFTILLLQNNKGL